MATTTKKINELKLVLQNIKRKLPDNYDRTYFDIANTIIYQMLDKLENHDWDGMNKLANELETAVTNDIQINGTLSVFADTTSCGKLSNN